MVNKNNAFGLKPWLDVNAADSEICWHEGRQRTKCWGRKKVDTALFLCSLVFRHDDKDEYTI